MREDVATSQYQHLGLKLVAWQHKCWYNTVLSDNDHLSLHNVNHSSYFFVFTFGNSVNVISLFLSPLRSFMFFFPFLF
jgi:hypothetical protein